MSGLEQVQERAQARIGTLLNGKWHLQSVLGTGGMATVYAAVHRNKKKAAVKMLHPELSLNSNIRQRFLREGYVANSIDHPGVVRVDDDDIAEDGAAYLVMELLQGETLDARADRSGGTLPLDEVLILTDQLLDVLKAAHGAGVIHRDLKPENLFLTTEGQLKVLDFGIARMREVSAQGRTSVGSFMGTPSFMSPEQARGRWDEVDGRSDIWAVGATMFTLLSGSPVHDAETVNEQLVLAATAPAPSLRSVRADLPDAVIELVDRALSRDRNERWSDANAMREQLRKIASIETGQVPRAPEGLTVASSSARASSERNVSPDDPTLVSGGGTAAAVTNSVPDETTGKRRRPILGLAGIALGLSFVAVVTYSMVRASSGDEGSEPEAPAKDPSAPVEATGSAAKASTIAVVPASSAPTPVATASASASSDAAPIAAMRKPGTQRTVQRAKPATRSPTGKAAPSDQGAPPRQPSGPDDLFDRRY